MIYKIEKFRKWLVDKKYKDKGREEEKILETVELLKEPDWTRFGEKFDLPNIVTDNVTDNYEEIIADIWLLIISKHYTDYYLNSPSNSNKFKVLILKWMWCLEKDELETKNTFLTKKTQELQNEIAHQKQTNQDNIDSLEKELESKKEELKNLTDQSSKTTLALRAEIFETKSNLLIAQEENKKIILLEKQLAETQNTLHFTEEQLKDEQANLQEIKLANESLLTKIINLESELKTQEQLLSESEKERNEITKQFREIEALEKNKQISLEEKEKMIAVLTNQLNYQRELVNKVIDKGKLNESDYQKQLESASEQISNLTAELEQKEAELLNSKQNSGTSENNTQLKGNFLSENKYWIFLLVIVLVFMLLRK